MALITSTELKAQLGITGTDYDAAITQILLFLPDWVVDFCNNHFINPNLYLIGSGISFSTSTISDSDSGFTDAGFVSAMDIYVHGSQSNDGHYLISGTAVTSSAIVVSNKTFTTETALNLITLYQVQFPVGLKLVVSNIVGYLLTQGKNQGISNESIGDYSVGYLSDLPESIIKQLKPYRKAKWL